MPYEYRFEETPTVVFDAVVEAIGELEKLGAIDQNTLTISFATKASGWSWGSQWVAQLTPDGEGTLATASMRAAGSVVAGKAEKKKIDRIWALAAGRLTKPHTRQASTGNYTGQAVHDAASRPHRLDATAEDRKAAKKAHREEIKRRNAQQRVEKEAVDRAMAGDQVAYEVFAAKTVMIYENSYVRVGGALFTAKAPYERLISIEASSDVTKKSGLGRGSAAVMTMGLNLATSNKRGDVYLAIVTDRTTHVLHEDPPAARGLKASKKLEAAGNAVIRANEASSAHWSATESPSDAVADTVGTQEGAVTRSVHGTGVPEKLRELNSMRDEGLVSSEEFEALRTKLLESF